MFTVLIRHGMMHGTDLMYCRQSAEKQLKRVAAAAAAVRVHQLLSYLYAYLELKPSVRVVFHFTL